MKSSAKRVGKWALAILGLVVGILLLSPILALLLRMIFVAVVHE